MTPSLTTLSSPEDFLALTPYVVGFHPERAIVVLAHDHLQMLQGFKMFDLTGSPDDPLRLQQGMTKLLNKFSVEKVAVIGYGTSSIDPALDAVHSVLEVMAVETLMFLRAHENRYWHYSCGECGGSQSEGTQYDTTTSTVTTAAVYNGLTSPPTREELTQTLAPVEGALREQARQATASARAHIEALLDTVDGTHWAREIRIRVPRALHRVQAGEALTADEVAFLGILLTSRELRNLAMTYIGSFGEDAHLQLWSEVTRRVEPDYLAAPVTILAFAALRLKRGALAYFALGRALAADPHYRLAFVMRCMQAEGMTPQQVADLSWTGTTEKITTEIERRPHLVRPILPPTWPGR